MIVQALILMLDFSDFNFIVDIFLISRSMILNSIFWLWQKTIIDFYGKILVIWLAVIFRTEIRDLNSPSFGGVPVAESIVLKVKQCDHFLLL